MTGIMELCDYVHAGGRLILALPLWRPVLLTFSIRATWEPCSNTWLVNCTIRLRDTCAGWPLG